MAELQTQLPPWLAEAFGPKQPDPPWILDAMRLGMQRQQMKAKLPLELQQMELANKANQLEIKTRGLQNDLINQEMNTAAAELPAFREYMAQVQNTPGGTLSVPPPAFRSQKYMKAVAERQKIDADTAYGMSLHQRILNQTKQATEIMANGGPIIKPGPDGLYDEAQLAEAGAKLLATKQANELAVVQARQGGSFTPVIETPVNPLTGERVPVVRTGPNTAQLLEGKEPADVIGIETERARAARAKGDEELARFHEARRAKLSMSSETTITSPDGTVVRMGPGGVETGDLTKANQSKVQMQLQKSLDTIDSASRLLPLISTETVGAQAWAGSFINDRILAQRFPELASEDRAKAGPLITSLRSNAVQEYRSDSNIAKDERNELLRDFPNVNDPLDSPARARLVTEQIIAMSGIQALARAKILGVKIPEEIVRTLDDEVLVDMVNRKVISPEMSQKIYRMKRGL